jgi:hypothetical protein
MTLQEAAAAGHRRVRLARWALPEDYLLLDVLVDFSGGPVLGPWAKLYSPLQLTVLADLDRPQVVLVVSDQGEDWEPYVGPPAEDEAPGRDERERQPWD